MSKTDNFEMNYLIDCKPMEWILCEKNLAKDWDKELKESHVGKAGREERWSSLLMLLQSCRGFEMEDEMREEL